MSRQLDPAELPPNAATVLRYAVHSERPRRPGRRQPKPPCWGLTWDQVLDGRTHIFPIGYPDEPWPNHGSLRSTCYREAARRMLSVETHFYGEGHFEVRAFNAIPKDSPLRNMVPVLYGAEKPVWHSRPGMPAANAGQWHEDYKRAGPTNTELDTLE